MGDKWREMIFEDAVDINPSRKILRGEVAPHVSMDIVQPFTRTINHFEMKEFKGSGSRFQNGDTLLARITPCLENGKTAFVSCLPDGTVGHGSTEFIVLSGKESISDNLFVYYLSREPEFRNFAIQQMEGSTGRQRVPAKALSKLTIDFPSLPEQKAIASILGALDDKIELNRKMNETLEAMARAIFKSSFTYPFEGLKYLQGEAPSHEAPSPQPSPSGRGSRKAGDGERELVDSPLGKIPKGWRVGKVSDVCSTQYGYTASASEMPIGPHFLRITDMNKEPWIDWQKVPYCSIDDKDLPKYILQVSDVLVSRMADPGKAAIVEENVNAVFASYLVRLKTRDLATAYYLFYFLSSDQYLDYSNGVMDGSVQVGMNAKVITAANMLLPPDNIIINFLEAIHPLRKKITDNLQQSLTLAFIRDSLLPKLLSGEIRVTKEVQGDVINAK